MAITEERQAIEGMERAKRGPSSVAGPYGHPFHPIFVTVPIGAWIGSLVLDVGSRVADDGTGLARGAWWLIGVGIIGAAVAAVFGALDLSRVPKHSEVFRKGVTHALLNVVVLAAFVGSFLWRMDRGAELETSTGQIVLSAVAIAVLGASGWIGGQLSYRFGVRVAREEDQVSGYR